MSETVDRSKCHPDCGKTMREHALSDHDSMGPGWVASPGVLWCSLACRTAKLPPIAPSATPVRIGLDINDASELTNKPPAPTHVERRLWQRWKGPIGEIYELTSHNAFTERWYARCGELDDLPMPHDSQAEQWRLYTLISDAPAEKPAGAVACPRCGKQTTRIGGFCSRECEKAGAIPACVSCLKPSPTVATRVVRKGRVEWCDACFVESDSYACLHEGLYGATGTPCAQPPGLLPRPRMARDEVVESDCLEDA